MANYNTLVAEIKARLGNRTDIDSRLSIWLNDAYFELLMEPEYTFFELDAATTIVTEADEYTYSLSDVGALWFILSVRDETNEQEVRKTSVKWLDRQKRTTGQPTRYARFADSLEIYPTPDAAYDLVVRYRQRPNALVSDAFPLINREWDELLVTMATAKGWEALEQFDKSMAVRQLIGPLVDRRRDQEQLEDEDSEIGIQVRRDY